METEETIDLTGFFELAIQNHKKEPLKPQKYKN